MYVSQERGSKEAGKLNGEIPEIPEKTIKCFKASRFSNEWTRQMDEGGRNKKKDRWKRMSKLVRAKRCCVTVFPIRRETTKKSFPNLIPFPSRSSK